MLFCLLCLWGYDVLSPMDVYNVLGILMFTKLFYLVEILPWKQPVEQTFHAGEVCAVVFVEKFLRFNPNRSLEKLYV